jgi:hypothetical protein
MIEEIFHDLSERLISVYLSKIKIYISTIEFMPEDLHVHGFLIFLILKKNL